MHRTLIIFLMIIAVAGCPQPGKKNTSRYPQIKPAQRPEPKFNSEFDRLVWLLGSPNFDKRKDAHAKLVNMGKDIVPDLEKSLRNVKNDDHRRQIQLVLKSLKSRKDRSEKRDLLVALSINSKSFKVKSQIEVTLEIKNTGNVALALTMPLLRKRSVKFRLDWIADLSFMSDGKMQQIEVTGTERDEWLTEAWNPTTVTVKPGESLKETIDISNLCMRPARYTVTATYRWLDVGDFMSNAVTFEVKKPASEKEVPKKEDGDN